MTDYHESALAWEDSADEFVTDLAAWTPPDLDPPDLARIAMALRRIAKAHADAAADVDTLIAKKHGRGTFDVDGAEVKVGRTARRTGWDHDALLRAVLDSRLVDTETGEIADETPLDKVRHVWNLGAPRTTALRDRGIDPDEFATTEWRDSVTYRQ